MSNVLYLNEIDYLSKLLSESDTMIYGAGKVAKTVIKYAAQKHYEIQGVLVSSIKNNPKLIMGIPVCEVSTDAFLDGKSLLVCVMEKLQKDIIEVLSGYSVEKIYCITDKLYEELIYLIADYEIEQIYALNSLDKKVSEMMRYLKDTLFWKHDFYWANEAEKKIIKENWGRVIESEDFGEKFLRLIKDLDADSIEVITRIINRQSVFLKSDIQKLDLYTTKEKEELRILDEDFNKLIIKLSDDIYMYKNYFLPCNRFEASVFFYKHGICKVKNIGTVKNKTIIDVGGYIGDSALVLSELLPNSIISFEAVPEHCEMFKRTMSLNDIHNVTLVNYALGKEPGKITMNLHDSSSTFIERKGIDFTGTVDVEVIPLDQYVEENEIQNIALIKVDIEGAEPDFLAGAKKTISKFKPILLLSIYHNAHDFFELKPMIESWNLGYKFSIYKPTNGNITNETLLIAEVC